MLIFNKPQSESLIELTYQFAPSTMIAALGHNLCFLCVFSYFSINLITFQAPPACSVSQILRTSVFISYCQNRMTTLWISVFKNIAQALRSPAKLCRFQTLSSASTKPATLPPKFPISHSLLRDTWKFWNFPVLAGSACSSGLLFLILGCVQTFFLCPPGIWAPLPFSFLYQHPLPAPMLLLTWNIPVTTLETQTHGRQVSSMHFAPSCPSCSISHMITRVLPQTWAYHSPVPESPPSVYYSFIYCQLNSSSNPRAPNSLTVFPSRIK